MNFTDLIKSVLCEKSQEKSLSDDFLCEYCKGLLKEDDSENNFQKNEFTIHLYECISDCLKVKDKSSRFSKGILERPFYLALIEMLTNCFGNGGKFPDNVKKSKVFMLENINLTRLEDIENEMKKLIDLWNGFPIIFQNSHKSMIKEFLFGFLNFEDLNTFLGLKTTFKSSSHLPPSFNECVESFTRVYIKKNQKKNPRNPNSSNILTIGGKALSKHSHRDKSTLFWGVCTGSYKKNEQANHVLAKIITNASWVNLHSLPHDILVYEIRNDLGYEPQMENGHANKWIH
ncbi:11873_t:CDS:2 [Entrophospora sp. SA101]|nr:7499_t:CDS:2 [Entrophospora sp. SA101]CAJ0752789.1 11873_t:CDS:2 [Entrophospora sp. SA101]CAJ0905839.1 8974_t:CDS:2 [Entrophospora sp. SA101]